MNNLLKFTTRWIDCFMNLFRGHSPFDGLMARKTSSTRIQRLSSQEWVDWTELIWLIPLWRLPLLCVGHSGTRQRLLFQFARALNVLCGSIKEDRVLLTSMSQMWRFWLFRNLPPGIFRPEECRDRFEHKTFRDRTLKHWNFADLLATCKSLSIRFRRESDEYENGRLVVVTDWKLIQWFCVLPVGRDPASVVANPLNRRADPDASADKGRSNLTFLRRAFGSQIDFTGKSSAGGSPKASNYGATPTCCHPPAEYWITAPFIRIRRCLLSFLFSQFSSCFLRFTWKIWFQNSPDVKFYFILRNQVSISRWWKPLPPEPMTNIRLAVRRKTFCCSWAHHPPIKRKLNILRHFFPTRVPPGGLVALRSQFAGNSVQLVSC